MDAFADSLFKIKENRSALLWPMLRLVTAILDSNCGHIWRIKRSAGGGRIRLEVRPSGVRDVKIIFHTFWGPSFGLIIGCGILERPSYQDEDSPYSVPVLRHSNSTLDGGPHLPGYIDTR